MVSIGAPLAPPASPPDFVGFGSRVIASTLDPYRPDLHWWLGNCPAFKCYDGILNATATMSCGNPGWATNLCHTAYEDQDHTLTYTFDDTYFVESASIYNKPGGHARLRHYTISVGEDVASLKVCASGSSVEGVDVYSHACGQSGRFMRLTVDNEGDVPINLREFTGVLHTAAPLPPPPSPPAPLPPPLPPSPPAPPASPPDFVGFGSRVIASTLDPYRPDLHWWLGNCPAFKCYDGILNATATMSCGNPGWATNLCHTAYEDQDHTLTYTFDDTYFVESASIYNKPGGHARLRHYTISVGEDVASLKVCASGSSVEGVDVYSHACGQSGRFMRLTVDNEGDVPINLREFTGVLHTAAPLPPPPPYITPTPSSPGTFNPLPPSPFSPPRHLRHPTASSLYAMPANCWR